MSKPTTTNEAQQLHLSVTGMTCDDCATGIDKLLSKIPGVESAKTSHSAATCSCTFDPAVTSKKAIIASINATPKYRVGGELPGEVGKGGDARRYDLVIIGGGSAAFSAAITADGLGLSTLMINAGLPFGGTCVNVGCVPSKNLIRAAEAAHHARHSNFAGIQPRGVDIDMAQVIRDKRSLVADLQQQKYMDVVKDLQGVTLLEGRATFNDPKTVRVEGKGTFTALKFLIATGATTRIPDIEGLADSGYLTNETLFDREELPASMTIMGAGYIGLEIAMAYNRLGSKVRILEFTDRVIRTQTADISAEIEKHMRNEGIEILPNVRINKVEKCGAETILHCRSADDSSTELIERGVLLVATGVRPNTTGLGLDAAGVELTKSGHIAVTELMATNVPHIFAAGDVANTPAFVYTAAHEGKTAVQAAFGAPPRGVDYSALPWVMFTDPQIAGAGMDEAQAAAAGIEAGTSTIELKHVARSIAANDMRGFIKLIRDTKNDRLIGARIVAPEGGELVQMLSLAIKHEVTVTELADDLYPYLTLSEGIKLAAIGFTRDVSKLSCCAS
jgi:mercuric reductase